MSLRQGTLHHIERTRQDVADTAPRRAYLQEHASVAGRYVLGDGAADADAYLGLSSIATATGRVLFYSTAAESTHPLYLVDATKVLI